ncbi:hypothetical protein [Streptosporangium amethystogenes]|uniref:hypothetical protein n=1 Tax=Streptosporangium amethystogenes TaxID=2002 RepID=UPI0004CB48F8|nr:hypothetical protein [Streptosporangium amethystogenes]
MKRYIAGLACAATAVLGAPALASTAHAQAADPITALQGQLKNGHGVTYVDTIKTQGGSKNTIAGHRKGELQFGTSGISASDHTTQLHFDEGALAFSTEEDDAEETEEQKKLSKLIAGLAEPERVVRVKKKAYLSGGAFGQFLPQDKPWLGYPEDTLGLTGSMGQVVNAAEPATLKALLAHATVKKPTAYAGKITFGELQKVSPWFRAAQGGGKLSGEQAKIMIKWKLFLNADRLPARLATSYTQFSGGSAWTVDTRYTNWGSKVTIDAPPADQVATMKELQAGFEADTPIPLLTVK